MKQKLLSLLLALGLMLSLAACGGENTPANDLPSSDETTETDFSAEACPSNPAAGSLSAVDVEKDGHYTGRDDVLRYLTTYGALPENYITTEEAQALGWTGGSLEDAAPGYTIGGDAYDNQAGLLPEGPDYRICDVDTSDQEAQPSHHLAYAVDLSNIYYSEDGGESFRLIYRAT